MERLKYNIELADNGVVLRGDDTSLEVTEQIRNEDARAYVDRALYKIMVIVREMLLDPQAYNLKNKDEFNIKIEVY